MNHLNIVFDKGSVVNGIAVEDSLGRVIHGRWLKRDRDEWSIFQIPIDETEAAATTLALSAVVEITPTNLVDCREITALTLEGPPPVVGKSCGAESVSSFWKMTAHLKSIGGYPPAQMTHYSRTEEEARSVFERVRDHWRSVV